MATQTRQLKVLLENHVLVEDLYARLKQLLEHELEELDYRCQKATGEIKKFADLCAGQKRDEFDDFYRKVVKKAKKTGDELDEVDKRLKEFDAKIQDSNAS